MKFVTEKNAKPWQAKALKATQDCLKNNDRCVTQMACGTGKTFVEAWLVGPGNTVVFVPSLYLMSQVAEEFRRSGCLEGKRTLYVCSDNTVALKDKVDEDENSLRPADCPWPVTTDRKEVRAFMAAAGDRVVFCTYTSSHLLADLGFDLGIFEESHRTAGRVNALFTFALHDKNIRIKKRLFFTATPKTYRSVKGRDGGEAVHCMDDIRVYGPRAFTYTLREAIKDEAICPYKIILNTVDSKQISAALQKARVDPGYKGLDRHAIGCALAIVQACREYGIKKVFTYHRLILDAQNFVTQKVVTDILCEWFDKDQLFTINGKMNDTQRRRIMAQFSAGRRGLISNAKCLAEGVNTPDCDAVVILNPKRGKIDVVQTAGRPLRLTTGKSMAYIILPVFSEDHADKASLHEGVRASDYVSVWDTVLAMAGNDPGLRHAIDGFRRKKGETGSYGDFEELREFIEINGVGLNIDEMREAIYCRVIDGSSDGWLESFGQWLKHQKEGKPIPYNSTLDFWVHNQRSWKLEKKLKPHREKLLTENGFIWDVLEHQWDQSYKMWLTCKKNKKSIPVGTSLYAWVVGQRMKAKKGLLSSKRKDLLVQNGFDFETQDSVWQKGLCDWIKNKKKIKKGTRIHGWVSIQRDRKSKGILDAEREKLLVKNGFVFNSDDHAWDTGYETWLKNKRPKHGSSSYRWTKHQKARKASGKIKKYQEALLSKNGFEWGDSRSPFWDAQYKKWLKNKTPVYGSPTQMWMAHQRNLNNLGELRPERKKLLAQNGFVWKPERGKKLFEERWKKRMESWISLKKSKKEIKAGSKIYNWITVQRKLKRDGKLNRTREKLLTKNGFVWEPKLGRRKK